MLWCCNIYVIIYKLKLLCASSFERAFRSLLNYPNVSRKKYQDCNHVLSIHVAPVHMPLIFFKLIVCMCSLNSVYNIMEDLYTCKRKVPVERFPLSVCVKSSNLLPKRNYSILQHKFLNFFVMTMSHLVYFSFTAFDSTTIEGRIVL